MLDQAHLVSLLERKDELQQRPLTTEGWAIIDGVLVIYDHADPPPWLVAVENMCDDDGNTNLPGPVVISAAPVGEGTRLVREMDEKALQRARDMHEVRQNAGLED